MRDDMVEGLTRKHLRGFNTDVAGVILTIVNGCRVRHRLIDSTHLLLYPPDKSVRPFKVSASRPKTQMLEYLEGFMEKYDLKAPEKEHPVAPDFTTPGWKPGPRPVREVALPEPETPSLSPSEAPAEEPVAVAPPKAPEPASDGPALPPGTPEGWVYLPHSQTGEPMTRWITKDDVFRCTACDWETKNRMTLASHYTQRHSTEEQKAERIAKTLATRARKVHAYDVMERVTREMAEALGWKLAEDLSDALAQVTAERDQAQAELVECRAKLELVREASSL